MGGARLAGRGREDISSEAFPTSDGQAGSKPNTAIHSPKENREKDLTFVQQRGRLRVLNLARKGRELHGTASISSSSGTLFLYASLTGYRKQLWHGHLANPAITCIQALKSPFPSSIFTR